jgi:P-type E1-E2 ATPase
MIEIQIPGHTPISLDYLVCDVNGTLALDGQLLEGVAHHISFLTDHLEVLLLTADTHGRQEIIDQQLNLKSTRLTPGNEREQKANYIRRLGTERVAAIGQGANDSAMLQEAAIGICVLSTEGTAVETLLAADIVVPDILRAFELFEKPLRLLATMRK